ncbi:hypothetical protein BVRB_032670 [Beta vulgaris subsp. vulgaris]|uniref:Uncharacterized protein n=1 Tax=Beta vulgaris subsp. vulgaris TaxID=3555 RepID=A0A0J8DRG2_BETVV|nr:hypothetical protein BVRB_032670 [Beta vulgaris subsp. vulgaris]
MPLTPLERVMKATKDRDTCRLLDVCNFVLSRCRLDSEEEATDTMLWMNVLVHVNMIANGPIGQMRCSDDAIQEFESMQSLALNLQLQHEPSLGPYECIVPVLSYDIRTSLNDAI